MKLSAGLNQQPPEGKIAFYLFVSFGGRFGLHNYEIDIVFF